MKSYDIPVSYSPDTCLTCGITTYVPTAYQEQRSKDGETYWCPNGHEQFYPDGRDRNDPDFGPRTERLLHLHQLEQAEAKAEDLADQVKELQAVMQSSGKASSPVTSTAPAPDEPVRVHKRGPAMFSTRRACPKCGKGYLGVTAFGKHVRRAHGLDPATLEA